MLGKGCRITKLFYKIIILLKEGMYMKRIIALISLFAISLSVAACSSTADNSSDSNEQSETANIHNPGETVSDWQTALQYLKDGNQRYVDNQTIARDTNTEDREALKDGQHPFAVIITCSDSRISPEIYLDQKLGDIFVIRNAGNITDATTLGSIEYAVEHLNAPLVVVVGHSSCGAVTAAFNGGEYPSNLQSIVNTISDSIIGSNDVDEAIHENITSVAEKIKEDTVVEELGTKVIGAYYDIVSGEISWLD